MCYNGSVDYSNQQKFSGRLVACKKKQFQNYFGY